MADLLLRTLERKWQATNSLEDEAAFLAEGMRVGRFSIDDIELAAYCGHLPAQKVLKPEATKHNPWCACELFGHPHVDNCASKEWATPQFYRGLQRWARPVLGWPYPPDVCFLAVMTGLKVLLKTPGVQRCPCRVCSDRWVVAGKVLSIGEEFLASPSLELSGRLRGFNSPGWALPRGAEQADRVLSLMESFVSGLLLRNAVSERLIRYALTHS